MFIDETRVYVKAGDGGNGCYSYMREKYLPKGRPNGGNGGRGGSVILEGSSNVHTLQDVSFQRKYCAERGQHGMGYDRYGKNSDNIIVKIPLGTIIKNDDTGEVLYDCVKDREEIVVAKGGRGGRGKGHP